MKSKALIVTECPNCGELIYFEKHPRLGQFIDCWYCKERLEVIDLDPVLLDFPLDDEYYVDEYELDYDEEW